MVDRDPSMHDASTCPNCGRPVVLLAMPSEHVALGLAYDWLFAAIEDVPPHQNTVGHRRRTTLERAGVKGVRLHDLRHSTPPV